MKNAVPAIAGVTGETILLVSLVTLLGGVQPLMIESCNFLESIEDYHAKREARPSLPLLGKVFHVTTQKQVRNRFIKFKIVPDVIEEAPRRSLRVQFKRRGAVAKFGNVLKSSELLRKPAYLTWPISRRAYYTLFMIDPDAVPYPNASWLHWYVANIYADRVRKGVEIAEYIPPRPKKGTGLHTIVFLVYKQPLGDFFFYDEMKYNDTRCNFTLGSIISKYKYERPVAGNFFQTQWEKPIPTKPTPPTRKTTRTTRKTTTTDKTATTTDKTATTEGTTTTTERTTTTEETATTKGTITTTREPPSTIGREEILEYDY